MARNGSGTYSLVSTTSIGSGNTISSTDMLATLSDIATAITQSIAKDGQTTPTANLPMGGFKLTGLGAATATGHALRWDEGATQSGVQAQTYTAFTTGGSSTAYTLTPSPAITANTTNQRFRVKFNAAAGSTPTLAVSGQTAKSLKYYDSTGTKQAVTSAQIPLNWVGDVEYDGTDWVVLNVAPPASTVDNSVNDFRLTLTAGVPVTTADVTGATTIYCAPYKGNRIALYDGSSWNIRTTAEFSLALGTLTASLPYDVFCYDNAGTPTLEFLAWSTATARATGLAYQDGVLSKTGALTRRYLGTFYTASTTTTEDSASKRYLENYSNQVDRTLLGTFSANRATTSATYVELNSEIQIKWVTGVSEQPIKFGATGVAYYTGAASQAVNTAISIDSTSAGTAGLEASGGPPLSNANYTYTLTNSGNYIPAVGFHYSSLLAAVTGAVTLTFPTATVLGTGAKVYLSATKKG